MVKETENMKIKVGIGERIFDFANVLIMLFMSVITLYPLIYVAFASVSNPTEIMIHRGLLLRPLGFSLDAYSAVFQNANIINGFSNTIFILVVGVVINIVATSMAAYVLSRKRVLWNNLIMMTIVFTMFFNGGLIPFYLVVKGIGIINSLWSLIIPFSISVFNLILMRTSFAAIPESLEESAKLDGAGHFTILFRIIIPLSMPVVAVMILYYGVDKWNAWFYASIFLKDRNKFPLQVILREILLQNDTGSMTTSAGSMDKYMVGETIKYATVMVATIPILLVYPFLQKYFVKGVMIGAVKG